MKTEKKRVDKPKKSSNKPKKSVSLLFSIQNLNFEWKKWLKPIDEQKNRADFWENQMVFSFDPQISILNFVQKNRPFFLVFTKTIGDRFLTIYR
jgi:hypothetical protein